VSTLFFDLDGTIVDVRERHYYVYSEACRQAGLSALDASDYWRRRRRGASTFDLIPPGDPAEADTFRRVWLASIERPELVLRDQLIPGAEMTLRQLGAAGYQLVIATLRRSRPALLTQVQSLGLTSWFSDVVSPEDADRGDKGVMIARAGHSSEDVVIGDSESDVVAARSLGIASVCVTTGVRSPAYLRKLAPTHIIPSIRELSSVLPRLGALEMGRRLADEAVA
jgi:phosphoglycolate phosphatase